jgi:hypothetical protein
MLGADLWVPGHTHDSFDYMAGLTRVVCTRVVTEEESDRFQKTEILGLILSSKSS